MKRVPMICSVVVLEAAVAVVVTWAVTRNPGSGASPYVPFETGPDLDSGRTPILRTGWGEAVYGVSARAGGGFVARLHRRDDDLEYGVGCTLRNASDAAIRYDHATNCIILRDSGGREYRCPKPPRTETAVRVVEPGAEDGFSVWSLAPPEGAVPDGYYDACLQYSVITAGTNAAFDVRTPWVRLCVGKDK